MRTRGLKCSFRKVTQIAAFILVILFFHGMFNVTLTEYKEVPEHVLCTELIQDLCSDYRHGLANGDQCRNICRSSLLHFKCLRLGREGKRVIQFTTENGENVIMKRTPDSQLQGFEPAAKSTFTSLDETLEYLTISAGTFNKDQLQQFLKHLSVDSVTHWKTAVDNGLALLAQPEFVTLLKLQGKALTPKLLGTCNRYFLTEYTPVHPSITLVSPWEQWPWTSVGPWPDRRKAAIALLQLITRLDKNGMAFCDVKGENVGFLETGEAVLLDVDTLFTNSELGDILSQNSCQKDYDCSFWDCHGICNKTTEKCSTQLSNTNFHSFCKKILTHHSSNGFHGLLAQVPSRRYIIRERINRYCRGWRLNEKISHDVLFDIRRELIHDRILG